MIFPGFAGFDFFFFDIFLCGRERGPGWVTDSGTFYNNRPEQANGSERSPRCFRTLPPPHFVVLAPLSNHTIFQVSSRSRGCRASERHLGNSDCRVPAPCRREGRPQACRLNLITCVFCNNCEAFGFQVALEICALHNHFVGAARLGCPSLLRVSRF